MDQIEALVYPKNKNNKELLDKNKIKELIPDIQPRDYRVLDHRFNYKLACLIIREKGYIIKLNGIRAIVTPKFIYLFHDDIEDFYLHLEYYFDNPNIISKEMPFELKIFEVILIYLCEKSDKVLLDLVQKVKSVSIQNINSSKLSQILKVQNELSSYEQMFEDIRKIIYDLMKSEEDMFRIYLSKKAKEEENVKENDQKKIDEFEILLETYEKQIKEDLNQVTRLRMEIDSILTLTEIKLAEFRNNVAVFNTKLTISTMSISISSFFASVYGMNLNNGLENKTGGVYICMIILILISSMVFYFLNSKLKILI